MLTHCYPLSTESTIQLHQGTTLKEVKFVLRNPKYFMVLNTFDFYKKYRSEISNLTHLLTNCKLIS